MPDPILPDFFRAQLIFQGKTGLSEDVYVNNFVFRNEGEFLENSEEVADNIALRLHNFLTVQQTSGLTVKSIFSSALIQEQYTVKVYDLGLPTPRLPMTRLNTLGALSSATAVPPEVAICLSYYAGRSLPRRRGRIYLGGLAATTFTTANGKVQVPENVRTTLGQAANGLMSASITAPVKWHVLSQRDANAYAITGGWVDDAPDTQRRRGHTATARTMWGAPPANV